MNMQDSVAKERGMAEIHSGSAATPYNLQIHKLISLRD
jgi:hypothetical protein